MAKEIFAGQRKNKYKIVISKEEIIKVFLNAIQSKQPTKKTLKKPAILAPLTTESISS